MFGPPPLLKSQPQPTNILNCNNPKARSAKGQTILSCISNMGRSKSGRSRSPGIQKSEQEIEKLTKKMENESARMMKDLIAIDKKYNAKNVKKVNGRRSGKLAFPTTPEYRIIIN